MKQLKSNDLINKAKSEFKKVEHIVRDNTGEEYKVLIQDKINDTAIARIIDGITLRSKWCSDNDIQIEMVQCMYGLLLREFTDITFSNSKDIGKLYKNELETLNALVDLEMLDQILNKFDESSIKKLQESFNTYTNNFKKINNELIHQKIKEVL